MQGAGPSDASWSETRQQRTQTRQPRLASAQGFLIPSRASLNNESENPMSDLVRVALYLNLILSKIKNNKIPILNSNSTKSLASSPGNSNEETQVLYVRNRLWIANNDDNDTKAQNSLLQILGITTTKQLFDHVDEYQKNALEMHNKKVNYNGCSPKGRLLYKLAKAEKLVGDDGLISAKYFTPSNSSLPFYTLSSETKELGKSIVFVKGNYESDDNHTKEHAEQKLLHVLIQHKSQFFDERVTIAGCKMACSTCQKVLEKAQSKLSGMLRFHYVNKEVDAIRKEDDIGLNQTTTSDIKALKID
jgi:hypothetical protein